ncbi:hypothetical protein ABBQ38_015212 [Trebouxia sp. C0009 RCD-2024]
MLPNSMNHSSPLRLLSMVMLGLLLGLFPHDALLLSPDSAALSSLAKQLGVDPAGDACSWQGITCQGPRVVGIFLNGYGLTGTLPEAWGQLSELENMDLGMNSLSGPIPGSWSNLTQLENMDLGMNSFTGPLPGSWSNLTQLSTNLILDGNQLTGSLPASWGNLRNLELMHLQGNRLTGPLPDAWSSLGKMSDFDLSNNTLTGPLPDSWQMWTKMGSLHLSDNVLTGPLPNSWQTWTNMSDIDLSSNKLTGPLPDSWQTWTNVGGFFLRGNNFTSTLPGNWSFWTPYGMDLGMNSLTGALPESWSNLTSLGTYLLLDGNQLTGSLPASWARLLALESLSLADNHLTGPLPDAWSGLTSVGYLNLSSNHLNGTLPASYGSNNLHCCTTTFDASGNGFHGQIPSSWANLSLSWLALDQNQLSGPLPDWDNADFDFLSISNNKLTGTLSAGWPPMKLLSLVGNKLTGTLPDAWEDWTELALEYLDLGDNMLSGSLPMAWSNMLNLKYISLAQNLFSGSVPSTWIASTAVQYVNFGSNNLSSSIPKLAAGLQLLDMSSNGLSELSYKLLPRSLKVLRLGNNKLAGSFPDVSLLPANLTILDLSYNLLMGSLPVAMPSKLAVINITHNNMNGTLPAAWHVPLAEARLGSNKFVGKLPPSWSQYGKSTSNSLQLSMLDTTIRGPMPQPWVQQFCLAIVRNSSTQVLFSPTTIIIPSPGPGQDISLALGSPITLAAQHASINVTLSGDVYTFDYQSPGSLCSIPHAQRNAAIFWGIFGAIFVAATVGVTFWLRRQVTSPMNKKLTILAYASSAMNHRKARVPKRIAALVWFCLTDVVWTLYSQVTDAITIHQVFGSGQLLYAYLLLAILLLPFLCVFFLVAIISVRHCHSSVCGQQHASIPLNRIVHNLAAVVAGAVFAPVLFVVLEAAMLTEGFGFTIAESLVPTAVNLSSFYRVHAVAEAFLNALPQAVVQTKLYLMGNDPKGIHVYINTTLFFYSVAGSALSVLKTVLLMIIEVNQLRCSLVTYFRKLMLFESLDDQGTGVSGQQASSAMGKTSSGTMLLPQSSVQLATLQRI